MHAGNGEMTDLGRRFVDCFVAAANNAEGLPKVPEFPAVFRPLHVWAVEDVLAYSDPEVAVPGTATMPRWSWDGLQA